ncbi:unnamed protein product, partial [Trichogramma brassicae]
KIDTRIFWRRVVRSFKSEGFSARKSLPIYKTNKLALCCKIQGNLEGKSPSASMRSGDALHGPELYGKIARLRTSKRRAHTAAAAEPFFLYKTRPSIYVIRVTSIEFAGIKSNGSSPGGESPKPESPDEIGLYRLGKKGRLVGGRDSLRLSKVSKEVRADEADEASTADAHLSSSDPHAGSVSAVYTQEQ